MKNKSVVVKSVKIKFHKIFLQSKKNRKTTFYGMKLINSSFPMIEDNSKKEKMPEPGDYDVNQPFIKPSYNAAVPRLN